MAKLTVNQEGQTPRQFQLNTGKLSIGSGEAAKLSLPGSELADVHADLEVGKDAAVLRLRRGVRPARVGGKEVPAEWTLAHNQQVDLGDVSITIEYEGAGEAGLVERRHKTTKGQAARKRSGTGRSSRATAGTPRATAGTSRSRVQSTRRTASRGFSMPSWAILLIAAVVLFAGYKVLGGYAESIGEAGFHAGASEAKIEAALKEGDILTARAEVERVANIPDLPPEVRARFDALDKAIDERLRSAELRVLNNVGTKYLDGKIRGYETKYLKSDKSAPRVRIILQRIEHFLKEWPEHPELSFVKRLKDRYGAIANLEDPMTLEDLEWEVHTLTWAMPRDYIQAYDLIRDFASTAGDSDKERAEELLGEQKIAEVEYAEDRLQQAKYLWEQDDSESKGKAFEWLVQLVIKLENSQYAEMATTSLLAIPDLDSRLRGYKETRAESYDAMMRNGRIRQRAKDLGI